jgi:hypothetical protein
MRDFIITETNWAPDTSHDTLRVKRFNFVTPMLGIGLTAVDKAKQ